MIEIIKSIIGPAINTLVIFYVYRKIFNKRVVVRKGKLAIALILEMLVVGFLYSITFSFFQPFKIFINFLVLIVVKKYLFDVKWHKSLTASFIVFVIMYTSEFICSVIMILLLKIDVEVIKDSYFTSMISNTSVSLLMLIISNINKLLHYFRKVVEGENLKQSLDIFVILLVAILSSCIYMCNIYFDFNPIMEFFITTFLIGGYTVFVFIMYREKSQKYMIQSRNHIIMKNTQHHEKMLIMYRMKNHESTNNLVSLRSMINKNNKKALDYINHVLENEVIDAEQIIYETKDIPAGGIEGLISQKLLTMKEAQIKYTLNVSREIKKFDFDNLDANKIYDICTIIGILLDNAIQAVENLDEKLVGIFFFVKNDIVHIEISNNYKKELNLEEMGKPGYTTKGDGHGYGLALVNKIIKKNKDLENTKIINQCIFSQLIKIKM